MASNDQQQQQQRQRQQLAPAIAARTVYLINQVAFLKVERDAAWRAINPAARPGQGNDWVKFAEANASYRAAYREATGGTNPPADETELASSEYYLKFCRR